MSQIETRGETARLVDNHYINNPIFGLVAQDGLTPLPEAVWDRVGEVADAVLKTVQDPTPVDWHVVFTMYVGPDDASWLERLAATARLRGAAFIPVRVLCDPDENARRIVEPGRRTRMKSADPHEPHHLTQHPNTLTLDVTDLPPVAAAAAILQHAQGLAAG